MTACMRDTDSSSRRRWLDANLPTLMMSWFSVSLRRSWSPLKIWKVRGTFAPPSMLAPLLRTASRNAASAVLDVFSRLQHLGDEVLADLDERRNLAAPAGIDELAVRSHQIALDHVVVEVVNR